MNHGKVMLILIPLLIVLRFLILYLKKKDSRRRVVPTKNFEESEKLGSVNKPFRLQATWRNEHLEFVTREVDVCAVEGHFALESNSWMISHIVIQSPGSSETELLSYWRLWHLQDVVTGEVAGDMHSFLLGRAGLVPAPYPFIFEQFDAKVPSQPINIEYVNKDDDDTRVIQCQLKRIEVRNSGVESFTFVRPNPNAKAPQKPVRLVRSKIKLMSLRPDGETSPPVNEPWEWLLRIAREWRPLDQNEPANGEPQRENERTDANAEMGIL